MLLIGTFYKASVTDQNCGVYSPKIPPRRVYTLPATITALLCVRAQRYAEFFATSSPLCLPVWAPLLVLRLSSRQSGAHTGWLSTTQFGTSVARLCHPRMTR